MIAALAFALTLSAAEPALAGAMEGAPPPPAGTVVLEPACQRTTTSARVSAPACGHSLNQHGRTARHQAHDARHTVEARSAARRTVRLDESFFVGGLTGGVERRSAPYRIHGHSVVIIGGSHAPRSAGQAAAARGLGRASH